MKKTLLVGLLLGGCASTNQTEIEKLLTQQEVAERLKTPVVCPAGTIKVCQAPDKNLLMKYPDAFCECHSNRSVARAFQTWRNGL